MDVRSGGRTTVGRYSRFFGVGGAIATGAILAMSLSGCDVVVGAAADNKKYNDAVQGCTEAAFKAMQTEGATESRALLLSVISKCMEQSSAELAGGKITCKPNGPEVRPGFPSDYTCTVNSGSGVSLTGPLGSRLDEYINSHPGLPPLGP